MQLFLTASLLVLGAIHAQANNTVLIDNPMKFKLFPIALFIGERAPITFEVTVPKQLQNQISTLSIVEVQKSDPTGSAPKKVLRYVGLLSDQGVAGDKRRGDGVLSRKFTFEERDPGLHHFAVIQDTAETKGGETLAGNQILVSEVATLTIEARPTLTEIMRQAWNKWKAR